MLNILKETKILLTLLLIAFITTSCIRSEAVSFDQQNREPKPDDYPIEILQEDSIEREYKVIGEVSADGPSYRSEQILDKLKGEAREMGGDALLSFQSGKAGAGSFNDGTGVYNSTAKNVYKAKVIIWIEDK